MVAEDPQACHIDCSPAGHVEFRAVSRTGRTMAFVYPPRSDSVLTQRSSSVVDCLLWSPEDVTIRFLESLALADPDVAEQMLAPDIEYRVGQSGTRRGRVAVMRRLHRIAGSSWGFDVVIHEVARQGGTVRTERTDALIRGRLRVQVAVRGTAEVSDGKIVRWHDELGRVGLVVAIARGLVGVMIPSIRAHMPPQ